MSQVNTDKIISKGDATIDIAASGNVDVNSDVYIDAANDRVGINVPTPTRSLDISGTRGISLNCGFIREKINITGTGISGDTNHDIQVAQAYIWNTATASWTPNFRYNGSETFASQIPVGQTIGFTIVAAVNTDTFYCLGVKIDGVTQTVEWAGGSEPEATGGEDYTYDSYYFQILRTGTGSTDYIVIASQNSQNAGSSFDVTDVAAIQAVGSPGSIAYVNMPSGPRTFLNYITSFGINQNSSNNNNSNWQNGYSGRIAIVSEPLSNISYFNSNGGVKFIAGDGSSAGNDWAVIDFGPHNNGDYDGYYQNNTNGRYFGGENTSSGGGANGVRTCRLWGFSENSGWILLYQHPAGQRDGAYSHQNSNWWNAGSTATSGNGKRSAYDTEEITHIGFSVST